MRLTSVTAVLGWLALAAAPALAAGDDVYKLGPGDHVQIHVSDFRTGLGEAYQWPMFSQSNEDFIVGPDGRLSIPVLGGLAAGGRSTTDLETEISSRLQTRAGLTARPDASVQIVKFRPFYVTGVVEKPGEYDYRPGLTVLQAVSIAGGMPRVTGELLLGMQKDALNARGDLRVLATDRMSLLARQARVDAEVQERDTVTFPQELSASADSEAARAMHEEQLLFDSRRDGLKKQLDALEQNKKFLGGEISRLREKGDTISKGLASTKAEFDLVVGLVKRGLSAAPRQLELEQNLSQIQSNQLDVEVAIVRANEDGVRADRDAADLVSKYRNELLLEAQDVRVKLDETVEKIETARRLVQQSEVTAPALLQTDLDAAAHPNYEISRLNSDGKTQETPAHETDRVEPGDVVRVIVNPDDSLSRSSSETIGARN